MEKARIARHYLEVLGMKARRTARLQAVGAVAGSGDGGQPVTTRSWESMRLRHGRQGGADAGHGCSGSHGLRVPAHAKLEASVGQALELGSTDIAAIRHLLMSDQLQHAAAGVL